VFFSQVANVLSGPHSVNVRAVLFQSGVEILVGDQLGFYFNERGILGTQLESFDSPLDDSRRRRREAQKGADASYSEGAQGDAWIQIGEEEAVAAAAVKVQQVEEVLGVGALHSADNAVGSPDVEVTVSVAVGGVSCFLEGHHVGVVADGVVQAEVGPSRLDQR